VWDVFSPTLLGAVLPSYDLGKHPYKCGFPLPAVSRGDDIDVRLKLHSHDWYI
jgi:hypothetical protein